jgi:acyl-CoA thioester hydrolase
MSNLPTSGTLHDGVHVLPVRVYYEDTDAGGIVYHASYLRWFERGRTEMLRLLGITLSEEARAGTGQFAVHEMHLVWRSPARHDDALLIETRCTRVRAAAVVMDQRVVHRGAILCSATVTVALLDMEGRPRRLPKSWTQSFQSLASQAMSD